MKKSILISFIVVLGLLNYTEVIGQLKVIPITEEEHSKAKFGHLSSLKDEFKDIEMIGLGEAGHELGGAYKAKTKMVKFLHEECGFNILAFEAPLYNIGIVGDKLKEGDLSLAEIAMNNCGVWTYTEMNELYRYILETQNTDNPLEYVGFDVQFFKSTLKHTLRVDFSHFIEKLNLATKSNIVIDSLCSNSLDIIASKSYYFNGIEAKDTITLYKTIGDVREALAKLDNKTEYFSHWNQITNSIESDYRKIHDVVSRDRSMAKNALYLSEKYKGEKIMLWAATYHLISNVNYAKKDRDRKKENRNNRAERMGEFIQKELKDKYYVIGFSPIKGTGGFKGYWGLGKRRFSSTKGTIEHYVNRTYNTDYAFISLVSNGTQEQLDELKINRTNGYLARIKINITEYVDGIYMYENEELITQNIDLFKERKRDNSVK